MVSKRAPIVESTSAKSHNKGKRRNHPSPKPILDTRALLSALDAADVSLKPVQLETFYQELHRFHYPPLDHFVKEYKVHSSNEDHYQRVSNGPLKNKVSKRKKKLQLPHAFLEFLATGEFCTLSSTVHEARTSSDGATTKLAVKLHDGELVESVLMRHINKGGCRATLCVSSQVGCAMGCSFCATATMGIKGNLNAGEILEQMVLAGRILAAEDEARENEELSNLSPKKLSLIRNVVFMGMGEPLNNYNNVVGACKALLDRKRWNLAQGHVTVSTVGVVPKMRQLTAEMPEISMALSLHAPNQEMRTQIVPSAAVYKIEELIDALDGHMVANSADGGLTVIRRRRAMIEYVMLEGETSTLEAAHQLGKLCENRHFFVNLIPYNPTDVEDKLSCPSEEHMKKFQRIVSSYGCYCFIRRTMGADIAGACGQLVVQEDKGKTETSVGDIEDGPFQKNITYENRNTRKTGGENKVDRDFEGLDKTIWTLSVLTSIAAGSFLICSAMLLKNRR